MIARLKNLFRRKPAPPTLGVAFKRAHAMVEEFEDLVCYVMAIPYVERPQELYKYMDKAEYMLASARDELQILYRTGEERKRYERVKAKLGRGTTGSKTNTQPPAVGIGSGDSQPGPANPGKS